MRVIRRPVSREVADVCTRSAGCSIFAANSLLKPAGLGDEGMERNSSVGLFLCFVLALAGLLGLGYYAYMIGGGLQVQQGSNIQDDFARAEQWHDVRR